MADDRGAAFATDLRARLARAKGPEERLSFLKAVVAEGPAEARAYLEYARELARTGRDDAEAIHQFRRALSLDPQLAQAYLGLGVLYHRRNEYELAESSYTAATRIDPKLVRAWLNLGALSLARGDNRGARRAYSKAAKLRPDDAAARQGLARSLAALGKWSEAAAEWREAHALDATDPSTLKGLAKALGALQDPEARDAYERAVQANPRSVSLRIDFSQLLRKLGDATRAEEVLSEGTELNTGAVALWRELAQAIGEHGRSDEQLSALREGLVQTAGDDRLRLVLVRALVEHDRLVEAARELRPVVLSDPRNDRARRLMAAVQACEGRYDEAATSAHAALRLNRLDPSPRLLLMPVANRPQHPMSVPLDDDPKTLPTHRAYALAIRGVLKLALGNPGEAGRMFDLASKASPETALPRAGRAVAYMAAGNLDAAHAELRTAVILEPNDAHVQHLFGEACFHLGQFEEASRAFQAALNDQSVDESVRAYTFYCRARCFRKRGLTREAIESYTQAERLDPEYAPSFFGCGKALQEAGKIEEGLRHYERCVALSPRHSRALQGMASCLALLGRAPEAVEAYRSVIDADRTYALPRYNLAVLLDRTGDPSEVVALLRGYLQRDPNGPFAQDARRRLRIAELRLAGALSTGAPLPDQPPGAFIDSSQDDAVYEVSSRSPLDPR